MFCKKTQLYISKIWNTLRLSVIITGLLCGYLLINEFLMGIYLTNNQDGSPLTKYYVISNIILYCAIMIHSTNIYSLTMYNEEIQECVVFVTLALVPFIKILYFCMFGYNNNRSTIYLKNVDFMFLVFSIALYVSVTKPISKMREHFDIHNPTYFFGNHFIKEIKESTNEGVSEESESETKTYTFLLVLHSAYSLVMLSMSFVIDGPSMIYIITTITSLLLSIIVIICEHLTNNVSKLCKISYVVILLLYYIYGVVNFFIYIPYKGMGNVTPKNIYFTVQGVILLLPIACLLLAIITSIACLIIYTIITSIMKMCSEIKKQVDDELNNIVVE